MNKRIFVLAAAVLATLLLSACTIQVATEIKDDGSGLYGFEMGFNQEDQGALAGLGSTPEAFCQDMQNGGDLPEGATITTEQRGADTYCVMSQSFASLGDLRALYSDGEASP